MTASNVTPMTVETVWAFVVPGKGEVWVGTPADAFLEYGTIETGAIKRKLRRELDVTGTITRVDYDPKVALGDKAAEVQAATVAAAKAAADRRAAAKAAEAADRAAARERRFQDLYAARTNAAPAPAADDAGDGEGATAPDPTPEPEIDLVAVIDAEVAAAQAATPAKPNRRGRASK